MKSYPILFSLLFSSLLLSQDIMDKALLWKISGNGLTEESYLFGTMHLTCEGEVIISPNLQNAFDSTAELLMELDMDDPNMMMKMMSAAMSKDGKTVTEKLGADLAGKVDKFLQEKSGMSLFMFDNVNLQTISMQVGMLALECPLDLGYDVVLSTDAIAEGKPIYGLETVEEQIKLLLSQSDEDAIKAIDFLVNNFGIAKKEMVKLTTLYKEEDIQGLYDFTRKTFEDPNFPQGNVEEFLDVRNENWIPKIEVQLKKTSTLIAVGAAHLAGERGVINLLKKQGYDLTPVN